MNMENCVDIEELHTGVENTPKIVAIKEPGSVRHNQRGKQVAGTRIIMSIEEAIALYQQLGERLIAEGYIKSNE